MKAFRITLFNGGQAVKTYDQVESIHASERKLTIFIENRETIWFGDYLLEGVSYK